MIHTPKEFEKDFEIQTDVLVIGAGPGGSAAAYKLAQKGLKVVILESGGYFTPTDFKRDGIVALKNLYQNAGQTFAQGTTLFTSMFGKGVGGGTLVNSGISFRPPQKAIQRWADQAQLKDFTLDKITPYLDEVSKHINIEILDVSKLGRNNTIFKEGMEKLNYRGGIVPRSTRDCKGCGTCYFGCPSGAKQSTDKNFISKSLALGAEVYTHTQVVGVDFDKHSRLIRSIGAKITDPETGTRKCKVTVRAKKIILTAGSLGSPRFLLNSRIGNSSGQVGKNFHCHPTTAAVGVYDEVINMSRQVMQGYYCDHFDDEDVLVETFNAPMGIVAPSIPGIGSDHLARMKEWKHFGATGAMIRDETSGEMVQDGDRIYFRYDLIEKDLVKLTTGMFRSAEILLASGAKKVYVHNSQKSEFSNLDELRKFFGENRNIGLDAVRAGNHGMGTCRMGEDPKTSVVDSYGHSHDIDNLWILDSSIFPSALGVNPQITIMALALRGADHII